ncbi:MAG: hypothetical protein VW829_18440 [Deltaproteobacteria bacterium]
MNYRYERIKRFLEQENFQGFTKKDLFIKNFIPKAWGQDIAALSNMAEVIRNTQYENMKGGSSRKLKREKIFLIDRVVQFAIHPKVNPWRKSIEKVTDFNHYGYYLEHLNIILGCYQQVAGDQYLELNTRVTRYLMDESLAQPNGHARLIPHLKMRWSADQAAIIYSLWLYDQNNATQYHEEPMRHWIEYMETHGKHEATGMYITEVMGTKDYSGQPRGCSHAYMCYYMEHFDGVMGQEQWELFKKHLLVKRLGFWGFREYLPDYKGKWTPDSGPIILGIGVAATGLALKPMKVWGEYWQDHMESVRSTVEWGMLLCYLLSRIPLVGRFASIGDDLLANSIMLSAETTEQKYV